MTMTMTTLVDAPVNAHTGEDAVPHEGSGAAVVLVLAEDIGDDTARAPFVSSVVRTIQSLTASSRSSQCNPGPPQQRDLYVLVVGSKQHASHLQLHDAAPANLATGGCLSRKTHRADWDKSWTSGEQIFGDIVSTYGIENFGPRHHCWAQLIDVGDGVSLDEVATEVELALRRRYCDAVGRVYMLVPPPGCTARAATSTTGSSTAGNTNNEEQSQFVQDMDLNWIKQRFESVWSRDGATVLKAATVEFVAAAAP